MSAGTVRRAAFLDRDGVVCIERGYLHRPEDFAFVPGALEGMRLLDGQGYLLAVVTNQSGIARGYFTEDDYAALTRHMVAELDKAGIRLAGIRHCPHLPDAQVAACRRVCECRKPAPGMILQLAQALHLDLAASVLVGDKASDVQAGRAAGVGRCMLVRSGHALSAADEAQADDVLDDLRACARAIVGKPPAAPRPPPSSVHDH
jgi:D-glycero-D-manno-heptose 1,7-bisphosphate phosphatase